jgi:nitrite reductase/ring-hydroxylating ferredoxin subunit
MADYVSVGPVSDFREGKIRRYFIDHNEIGVVLWGERFYAFSNRCPHRDFQLHFGFVEDDKIYCPIHYAVFDIATGARLEGPWVDDLPIYGVRVEGDVVQVKLEPLPGSLAEKEEEYVDEGRE